MLHSIFMTIRSEFPGEAFYQIFRPGTANFTVPLDFREGWLNTDQPMVEVMIPVRRIEIQVGFRRQASVLAGWVAAPVQVETLNGVILTATGQIQEGTPHPVQMGHLSDARFISNELRQRGASSLGNLAGRVIGKLVNDSPLSETARDILSGIPYGSIVSAIANMIWPEPSVSSLIADAELRMRNMIISKIRQADWAQQTGLLAGIRRNLEEYQVARGPARLRWMENMLESFNTVKGVMLNRVANYTPGSAYLVLDLAGLHLALLRERVAFEEEIFGDEKPNSASNLRMLELAVHEYQEFLTYAVEQEVTERLAQLSTSYSHGVAVPPLSGIFGQVTAINVLIRDNVRRTVHRFRVEGSFNSIGGNIPTTEIDDVRLLMKIYEDQVHNEMRIRLMEDILVPARMLTWFLPGMEKIHPIPLNDVAEVGPITGLIQRDNNHPFIQELDYHSVGPGKVHLVQVVVMMAVQLNFGIADRRGEVQYSFGERISPGIMLQYERELPEGVYVTRVESWWDDSHARAVKLTFSDAISTERIGTSEGGMYQIAELAHHGLCQVFLDNRQHAWKFGFRLMPSFYNLENA